MMNKHRPNIAQSFDFHGEETAPPAGTNSLASRSNQAISEQPHDSPSPFLVLTMGGARGMLFPLPPGYYRLGRHAENNLFFWSKSVSRFHAEIESTPHGSIVLTDLGSSNGTFINETRIPARVPTELRVGDIFRLGLELTLNYLMLTPREELLRRIQFKHSVSDTLTGVHNRAFFMDQIPGWIYGAQSRQRGVAIVMADVDKFKTVNDTYGHPVGDQVLVAVARHFQANVRPEELLGRYGGEEFVMALEVDSREEAVMRLDSLRAELARNPLEIPNNGLKLPVTASFGVAYSRNPVSLGVDPMLAQADEYLYIAKRDGRNAVRITCSDDDEPSRWNLTRSGEDVPLFSRSPRTGPLASAPGSVQASGGNPASSSSSLPVSPSLSPSPSSSSLPASPSSSSLPSRDQASS